jgi:hypothetical protein
MSEDTGSRDEPLIVRSFSTQSARAEVNGAPVGLLTIDLRTVPMRSAHVADAPLSEHSFVMQREYALKLAGAILQAADQSDGPVRDS